MAMSQTRGKTLHREFPRLLTGLWPSAEACPPGRNGRDVLGTPGVAWEVKTAGLDNLRPNDCVDQAYRNSEKDVPVVAWFPQGVCIGTPSRVVAMLPLNWLLLLLEQAGLSLVCQPFGQGRRPPAQLRECRARVIGGRHLR